MLFSDCQKNIRALQRNVIALCMCVFVREELVLKNPGDRRLFRIMLKLGQLTHLAYDCPKKHSAAKVMRAARELLKEAGLH